jgi:hypothetical protein
VRECVLQDRVADSRQTLERRWIDLERRQTLLGIALVELQMRKDQGLQQRAVLRRQGALLDQDLGHRAAASGRPHREASDKLVAADHAVLKRQDSE